MVVTKTKKKVTKVTKHKVTNNKTKKRNKNKRGGGAGGVPPISPRRNSAPAIRRNSAPAIRPKSASAIRPKSASASRTSVPPKLLLTSKDDIGIRNNSKSPRNAPVKKSKQNQPQPGMPIDVNTFKDKYNNAIIEVNKVLLSKKDKKGIPNIPDIPDIINNIIKPVQFGGDAKYTDDIAPLLSNKITSYGLSTINFDEPNPAQHNDTTKYDVVIVGCSPEALYMSILLKLLMPTLSIVILECGENAEQPVKTSSSSVSLDEPDNVATEVQAAREQENSRALTKETMMSLKYIWANVRMEKNNLSTLNNMITQLLPTNKIYYHDVGMQNALNIFPSCFYTEDDIHKEHRLIFPTNKDVTAKIQVNILEFFLTRRAIELGIVILHNVTIIELSDYVGPNTLAIFNATGFFDMFEQKNIPVFASNKYKCIYGLTDNLKPNPDASNALNALNKYSTIFNTPIKDQFKLENKYGYYIALKSSEIALTTLNSFVKNGKPTIVTCSNRYETVNSEPLEWYHVNRLHVPIISIGKSLRGKIFFEWNYLGFADCFIYGLLFKRIYDTTAPAASQPVADELPPPPSKLAASPVAPVASPVAAQADSASLLSPPPSVSAPVSEPAPLTASLGPPPPPHGVSVNPPPPPPDDVNKANEEPYDKKIDILRSKLLAARVVAKFQDNVRAKQVAEEAARANQAAEAAAQAKAIADAEAEEDLREKAAANAEEDARLKVLADAAAKQAAEDAARAKQAAEDAAAAKQATEEAARAKQATEEAARVKLAAEETARVKLAAEEAARVKLAREEAAREKQAAEEAARVKLATEEAAREKQSAEEAAREKQAAEEAEQARLKRIAEEKEAQLQAVKTAEEAKLAAQEARKKEDATWRENLLKKEAILEAARLEANRIKTLPQTLPPSSGITIPPATGITNSQIITGDISPDSIVIDMNNENETPTDNLEIVLGTNAPTTDGDTLEITIQDALNKEEEKEKEKKNNVAETQTPQTNNLEIVLGTNAPTGENNTLEISIQEREGEEVNDENAVQPPMDTLEIVLGTDAPTRDGDTLEISIQEGEGEGETQSSNYLQSVADGARGVLNFVSDKTSAALSGTERGIVAAAKGAADTATKCTTDRAADATRKALEYEAPIKSASVLKQEQKVDAQLEELKNQIKDNVADAGELFVDNAKKLANTVASYNPFKGVDTNATKNLLLSQNLNPPVKYLNISINPGIEFNPKMLNKNTSNADVHFNPLIKYSERIINDVPVGQPKAELYEKFFNNNSFNIMLANTLRGLFGQTPKTIDEATDAGIVDDNIVSTLNTLFATGNVIYINNSPYTIYTYSWNGEWSIDSKMPRNLDYITGTSSSSFIRDQEQIQRYREIQNAAAQKELKQKGIGEKYRMSSILRERLMEDAKQREALQKEQDAKTTAKKVEDDAATEKKTAKQTYRTERNNQLKLRKDALNAVSNLVPELKKEVMKAALNAIVSHKQFIRATQEERDIEIDPLTISLFYPTDDLLQAMLEKTKLSQDYLDAHKTLIKIIEEYDAAEMEMYETKKKMDNMYGKLNFMEDVKKKEEIINGLLKGKNLQYDVTKLTTQTFTHVANLFGALSETKPSVTPSVMTGGLKFPFTRNKVSETEPPTFETIIDSTDVVLDNSNNKKENAVQTEMVKYLGKQIVTTFYKDISDLQTMVTRFQQMLENMVELTKKQYASQRKYYEQYITFLDKLEKVSNQTKEKENGLFLMCIAQDKTTYEQMLKKLIAFDMDKIQIPVSIDATNYYKNNSLMGIDSTYFTTFIAQILEKRYSVSNQLWEISSNSALKAHNEFKTLNEKYNLKKYEELFEAAQQQAADLRFDGMYDNVNTDSPKLWGAEITNRYTEYKQYKKQRDDLQAVQDGPNNIPALTSATPLFQGDQTEFKRIYDEYDSKEARGKRFKTMFIDVALAEIATLRKITFLTQSIHAADIEIYKCMLNEGLFKQHAENCAQPPAVKSEFYNVTCVQDDLDKLITTNGNEKAAVAQKKQDFTGQLTLLSDNQNNMFANLFPIDANAKLEKMCNQAATDVTTLFQVTTLNTFMDDNKWSNDCPMPEINAQIAKAFKLAMLNEMFTHALKPKKVSPSVYKNTNYWDLFCPVRAEPSSDLNNIKLLDAVSMLLNAEMHLTSSTIECKYAPKDKFDLKTVPRIIQLLNPQTPENDQLAILYQIFKIKFTIIEITYEQPLNIKLSIIGCTNKLTARSKSDGEDAYIPEEDVRQIAQDEKLTTFAFIIKYQGNYYIPYNSKIGTLLCSTKHLKSVGLDILLWSKCSNESQGKKKYAPPSWLKMYQTIDAAQQRGGADTEAAQQIASTGENNNNSDKTIEETTKENTQINAGVPVKSILKKSVKIEDEVSKQTPPAASEDTVNYSDKYRVSQTYSRDSKLSYYVAIDLVMVPGTSISLAQKLKLKCQMKSDNIRKSLSEIFGTIYVPTPIFITTSEEYAKSKTEEERNRIIQYQTVTDLVNEKKMNNLRGRDFINAMRETIPRSNRMKNAFTHLRIASGEYNSILKNHDITIEELNSLITDANYQRNFMGGRSKKASRRATTRLRKTRKQKF